MAPPNQGQEFSSSSQSYDYEDGRTRVRMSSSQQTWSSSGHSSGQNTQRPGMPLALPQGFGSIHSQMHNAAMAHHQSALQHMAGFGLPQQPMLAAPTQRLQLEGAALSAPGEVYMRRRTQEIIEVEDVTDSSEEESSEDSDEVELHTYRPVDTKTKASRTREKDRRRQERHEQRLRLEREQSQRLHDTNEQALQLARDHSHRTNDSNRQAMQLAQDVSNRTAENNAILASLSSQYQEEREHRRRQEQRHDTERAELREIGSKMEKRMRDLEDKDAKTRAQAEENDREMRRLRDENAQLHRDRLSDANKHRQELTDMSRTHAEQRGKGTGAIDAAAIKQIVQEVQANQLSKTDIEKIIQDRVTNQLDGIARSKDIEAASSRMQKALASVPTGATAEQVEKAVNKELGKAVNRLADKVQPKLMQESSSSRRLAIESGQGQPTAATLSTAIKKHHDKQSVSASVAATERDVRSTRRIAEPMSNAISMHQAGRDNVSAAPTAPPRSTQAEVAKPSRVTSLQVTELPDDFPDRASQISSYERRKKDKGKASASALTSIAEAPAESSIVSIDHPKKLGDGAGSVGHSKDRHGKGKMRALPPASEPTKTDAVARIARSDTSSRTSDKSRDKAHTDETRRSTTADNALVRRKSKDPSIAVVLPKTSSRDVDDVTKRTASLQLPESFPDRASQISTWERSRSKKDKPASRLTGASPLRQISMPPADDASDNKGLVRLKKDK